MPKIVKTIKPLCQLYTIGEAASILGVSVATIRQWVWLRKIESTRVGRSVRLRKDVLEALVNEGTTPVLAIN